MITFCVQLFNKHNITKNYLLCRFVSSIKKLPKSSLFVSGERAVETFVVVIPHLNFDEVFADMTKLEKNIARRGLNLNVIDMKDSWNFYNDWKAKGSKLKENLDEIGKQIKDCLDMDDSENKRARFEILKRRSNLIKVDLQQVKKNVWSMDDNVISELLNIPNYLHPECPDKDEEIFQFHKENIVGAADHLVIGEKLDCVEYRNNVTCFLTKEAALFELAVQEFFIDNCLNKGFIRFSNPDFARSVLAEGVGLPPGDSSEMFLLEQTEGHNRLHLCGGASLFPFCGFHAKHTVPRQSLPVRYITAGRRYTPSTDKQLGLYSLSQATCVQIFTATSSEEHMFLEFQTCVDKVVEIYGLLGLNFKVVKQAPKSYKNWECLRTSVLVYSPHLKDFIEVGSISVIDDYVSKRLRMCYNDKSNEMFLRVVTGTLVNTHVLLALCLERSNAEMFIPQPLKNYMLL